MKGDAKVIQHLNNLLKHELTAVNQFFLHSRMLEDWGVMKMAKHEYDESIEEMQHADTIIKRILLLEGLPNLQDLGKLRIGETVKEVIECDLAVEKEAVEGYREAIKDAEAVSDYVTAQMLKTLLADEEEHQDHLETQLTLIENIGLQNYIQMQSGTENAA